MASFLVLVFCVSGAHIFFSFFVFGCHYQCSQLPEKDLSPKIYSEMTYYVSRSGRKTLLTQFTLIAAVIFSFVSDVTSAQLPILVQFY